SCGRRSRVGLIPDADIKLVTMLSHCDLRRRQQSPVSEASAKETVKTIARGKPGDPAVPVVD
ncbi:hypothetical protein, partial [Bradyrhizobium sp.]|uniref:hypothetical protein n=1 Tax=Bradyrhizobium sp. TaxID=376 RepID=UPI003C3C9A1D